MPRSTYTSGRTTGVAVKRIPKGYAAPRDRAVPCKGVVPCKHCGVGIDESCVSTVTGKPVTPHRLRRVMALRAEREGQS